MNRTILYAASTLFAAILVGSLHVSTAAEPFAELAELTKDRVRWAGSMQELAANFNAERDRLGE